MLVVDRLILNFFVRQQNISSDRHTSEDMLDFTEKILQFIYVFIIFLKTLDVN